MGAEGSRRCDSGEGLWVDECGFWWWTSGMANHLNDAMRYLALSTELLGRSDAFSFDAPLKAIWERWLWRIQKAMENSHNLL